MYRNAVVALLDFCVRALFSRRDQERDKGRISHIFPFLSEYGVKEWAEIMLLSERNSPVGVSLCLTWET